VIWLAATRVEPKLIGSHNHCTGCPIHLHNSTHREGNLGLQVVTLGSTQTVAWASSTYLPAILSRPIAQELGIASSTAFGAFSLALLVMAISGPMVGHAIDRMGGGRVLVASNMVIAAGLVLLASAGSVVTLIGAWCVLGIGMAMGLYDAAFATLVQLHGQKARAPILGITLIAGFASTIGWPLTTYLVETRGWAQCCLAWAALNLLVALPLNWICIPAGAARTSTAVTGSPSEGGNASDIGAPIPTKLPFIWLTIFSAATAFVTSALAAHLPGLLIATGVTQTMALSASTLLGPAQVAARVSEFGLARRWNIHPLYSARFATALHPLAALLLVPLLGLPAGAISFALMHGAGNGMITIAKGTLPLVLFGASGYGLRTGLLAVAARIMQAVAPFAYGLVLEILGAIPALMLSTVLSLIALGALFAIQASEPSRS
jgi:MFS family permease